MNVTRPPQPHTTPPVPINRKGGVAEGGWKPRQNKSATGCYWLEEERSHTADKTQGGVRQRLIIILLLVFVLAPLLSAYLPVRRRHASRRPPLIVPRPTVVAVWHISNCLRSNGGDNKPAVTAVLKEQKKEKPAPCWQRPWLSPPTDCHLPVPALTTTTHFSHTEHWTPKETKKSIFMVNWELTVCGQ